MVLSCGLLVKLNEAVKNHSSSLLTILYSAFAYVQAPSYE